LQETYLGADPPCLRYEYVEGGDLGGLILDWHRQDDKPNPEYVARTLLQIAEIVAFAHRLNPAIVHRDLKPANILVQWSGGKTALRITDFGIGGIAASKTIQMTQQATSQSYFLATAIRGSGTLLYASPEQLRGNPPDPRDDVHALGVLWYQMLTGDLTKGRPGGSGWRRRFADRGMSDAMLNLLESCFEDQEDRPADGSILAERLSRLLKPPSGKGKQEVRTREVQSLGGMKNKDRKPRLRTVSEEMDIGTEFDEKALREWLSYMEIAIYDKLVRDIPDGGVSVWVGRSCVVEESDGQYTWVAVGGRDRYAVLRKTAEIFECRAIGQVNRSRCFGTVAGWREWDWSTYYPTRRGGTDAASDTTDPGGSGQAQAIRALLIRLRSSDPDPP
jgi:serine/threonine protein kinase